MIRCSVNVSDISVKKYTVYQMRAYAGGHHEKCGAVSIVSGNAPQHLWCRGVLGMSEGGEGATDQQ